MMRIHEKVVMTLQNIAALERLLALITNTPQEANENSRKIQSLRWKGLAPKWDFMETIDEDLTKRFSSATRSNLIKCVGWFRCRQTHEVVEKVYYQNKSELIFS